MIKQAQSRPHPNGDCVRACISTLLELPITEVPDWMAMRQDDDGEGYPTWYLEMQDWLKRRGLAFVEIQLERKTWMPLPYPALAIFIGPLQTEFGLFRHAIVGRCEDGKFLPVFDPYNPEGDPAAAFVGGRVDAVCFLVPLDPARLLKKQSVASALNGNIPGR